MLRKKSWTSLEQKKETTTPAMMGGELTVVKCLLPILLICRLRNVRHGYL
jgi:hypothetical protein